MKVIGLVSGTSFDAIEVAVAELDLEGEEVWLRPLGATSSPYPPGVRERIAKALPPSSSSAGELCRLDTLVGQAFAAAARKALEELTGGLAELIVSHGQTIYHWVEDGRALGTLQLGQPAWIAEETGLPVVADLRSRDVAAGGQGAPLASLFDVLLLAGTEQRRAALNLGGIANLTVVCPDREPLAFDVGPANALLDAAVTHYTGGVEPFDAGGARGARGSVDEALLGKLLQDPYYELPLPKSTGKERFHLPYLLGVLADHPGLEPDDVIATLTALTAQTVARECRRYRIAEVMAAGGGVRNATLMDMLAQAMPAVGISTTESQGIPVESKEAYVFALLGFLTYHGVAATLPSCTGAGRPSVLGCLVPGAAPLRLPQPAVVAPKRLLIAAPSLR